jgi:hypothetical protein
MTQAKASHTQKEMYQNPTLILDPKNVGWDPEEQLTSLGEGFIVTIFNDDVLLHDYHLHQDNKTTIRNYQLQKFSTNRRNRTFTWLLATASTVMTYLVLTQPLIPNND